MSVTAAESSRAKRSHLWQRAEGEWYVEPVAATEALLSVEHFAGRIDDPCCGGGNIVRTLRAAGYDAHGADIAERWVGDLPDWWRGTQDFLTSDTRRQNIVMNPPYGGAKLAEAFIRQALLMADGKVCAFLDVRFLAGGKRAAGLWSDSPPDRVWIIAPRVSCPPGAYLATGGKAGNGSSDYCWAVWDGLTAHNGTHLGWAVHGGAA